MEPIDVAREYLDAWNRHDSAAIVATFADGGTYSDPIVPQGLTGPAIGHYANGLFGAFPDLSFDVVSAASAGQKTVAVQWLMRGTNAGLLQGNPPTGGTVALPGADFIVVEGEKVRSVKGYLDQKTFVEQLGLQAIVAPTSLGPMTFGSSARVSSGKLMKRARRLALATGGRLRRLVLPARRGRTRGLALRAGGGLTGRLALARRGD